MHFYQQDLSHRWLVFNTNKMNHKKMKKEGVLISPHETLIHYYQYSIIFFFDLLKIDLFQ